MTKEQKKQINCIWIFMIGGVNELSHDKNYLKTKDIALYLINNNIKLAKDYNPYSIRKLLSKS